MNTGSKAGYVRLGLCITLLLALFLLLVNSHTARCSFAINMVGIAAVKGHGVESLQHMGSCTAPMQERVFYFSTWVLDNKMESSDSISVDQVPILRQLLLAYRLMSIGDEPRGIALWQSAASRLSLEARTDFAIGLCEHNQVQACISEIDTLLKEPLSRPDQCSTLTRALVALQVLKSHSKVMEYALKGTQDCPSDPFFYYQLAEVTLFQNTSDSLAYANTAEQLGYDPIMVAYLRGKIFRQAGNWQQAIIEFEIARKVYRSDPWLLYWLGDSYWHVGEREQALSLWQDALKLAPGFKDAQHAIDNAGGVPK